MVYKKNFAAAIKANGKVLREQNGSVFLPFGQEYSITLKNLNSVRASVNISIDGKSISENGSLVVGPNKTVDIERFISNLNCGNRFKFIERTSTIENHRGIRVDDSLIRIEFSFEKKQKTYFQPFENVPYKGNYNHQPFYSSPVLHRSLSPGDITCQVAACSNSSFLGSAQAMANNVGITVPGSISDQKFSQSSWFETESETEVIVLQLIGQVENVEVVAPITVKHKPKCITCGKLNRATSKFCSACGTSLSLI